MSRDAILDAAAQIFRQKGYHAASMQDIADEVGLQKASLYHHVASKQEILLALLERALAMVHERVEAAAARSDLTPDDKLRQMMRVYLEALGEEPDLTAVLLFEHRSLEPKLHARHVPNRDRFEALWKDVIRQGARAGVFHCPDPGLAVRAVLGLLNSTVSWYRPGGSLSAVQIANQYANLVLDGLRVKHD